MKKMRAAALYQVNAPLRVEEVTFLTGWDERLRRGDRMQWRNALNLPRRLEALYDEEQRSAE